MARNHIIIITQWKNAAPRVQIIISCYAAGRLVAPELGRDVGLDDALLAELGYPLRFGLHLLVFLEMLNVLGVGEVLELGVFVVVSSVCQSPAPSMTQPDTVYSLLPVVDLVLVLIITVVPRTRPHIWEGLAGDFDEMHKLVTADQVVAVGVDQV